MLMWQKTSKFEIKKKLGNLQVHFKGQNQKRYKKSRRTSVKVKTLKIKGKITLEDTIFLFKIKRRQTTRTYT